MAIRVWVFKPLAISWGMNLTYGPSLAVTQANAPNVVIPSEAMALSVGPCPQGVVDAAGQLAETARKTGTVDQSAAQSLLDALNSSGNGDVGAVFVSAAQPGAPGPNPVINVSNPKIIMSILDGLAALQAFAAKYLSGLTAAPSATNIRELPQDAQFIIEGLGAVANLAPEIDTTASVFAALLPSNVGPEPQLTPIQIPHDPAWKKSWKDPDGSMTMVGAKGGVTLTLGLPDVGTLEPTPDGTDAGGVYFPPDGGSEIIIDMPDDGVLGGEAGPGGGPGRPEIP